MSVMALAWKNSEHASKWFNQDKKSYFAQSLVLAHKGIDIKKQFMRKFYLFCSFAFIGSVLLGYLIALFTI